MPGPYGFVIGARYATLSRRGDKMLSELRDGVLGGNSASIGHRGNRRNHFIYFNHLRIRIRARMDRAGIGLSRKAAPTGAVLFNNLMTDPIIIITAVVGVLAALLQ